MISLYQLNQPALLAMNLELLAVLSLQMFCFVYGFFSFRYRRRTLWRSLLDAAVLLQLFLLLAQAAETFYHCQEGFIVLHPRCNARNAMFFILSALSIGYSIQERTLSAMSIPATALLTLPLVERHAGGAFPVVMFIAVVFWLLQASNQLAVYQIQRKNELSAFSVKEAVDSLDFGVLFCKASGRSRGQILLTNQKMQELMTALTGSLPYNAVEFYDALLSGAVRPGCERCQVENQLVYSLPDGRVWWFERQPVTMGSLPCAMLSAADITEQKQITDELYRLDQELTRQNRDLTAMLDNMQQLCRSEQTLRAKNRVHDLLGQQISLFLRAIREHREPDEALLRSFADGLPEELKNDDDSEDQSLLAIAKSYRSIGVEVRLEGHLPPQAALKKLFTEIATEAMTNAVRHGYATRITIRISRRRNLWEMQIRDNGIPKDDAVLEGGGLTEMRRKAAEAGGSFSYQTAPCFQILVQIPGGMIK